MPNLTKSGILLSLIKRELLIQSTKRQIGNDLDIRRKIIARRTFLEDVTKLSFGALSGASLFSSCNFGSSNEEFSIVGILGGGIAGLSAGIEFSDQKIDFKVFEASNQPGGRILTLFDVLGEGINTELGGEFIDSNHSDMFRLAKKFNLPLIDIHKKINDLKLTRDSFYFEQQYFSESSVIEEFSRFSSSIFEDIVELNEGNEIITKRFDLISITDYLKSKGISGWFFNLLSAAFTAEFGLEASLQSSLNFLTMIDVTPTNQLRLYGDSDERYTFKDGNQVLIQRMANSIAKNVYYGHLCQSIVYQDGRYHLIFNNGKKASCIYLLVTLPFTALRRISINVDMPAAKRRIIDELNYGTNSKISFATRNAPWRDMRLSGYLFSDYIQNGWDSSIAAANAGNAAYTIFQGGNLGMQLNVDQSSRYLDELNDAFPGFIESHNQKKVVFNWTKSSLTRGSYAVYRVGDWIEFAGLEFAPVGNMHFAGEHCSTDFKGYMNGGAETGRLAAESIIARLKSA